MANGFDLKKDWPVVAAAGAGLLGVVLVTRGGGGAGRPVAVGGGTPAGYGEAIAAQSAVSQATLAAKTTAFTTLVSEFGATERAGIEAQAFLESRRLETVAVTRAAELQAASERERQQYGLIGSIIAGIFSLFSWETTAAGVRGRALARTRFAQAYGVH